MTTRRDQAVAVASERSKELARLASEVERAERRVHKLTEARVQVPSHLSAQDRAKAELSAKRIEPRNRRCP